MDAFPVFADGDVRIVVSPDKQYKLHSGALKNNSTTFRRLLTAIPKATLNTKAIKKGTPFYQLELIKNPRPSPNAEYVFRAVELDSHGHSLEEPTEASFFRLVELENNRRQQHDGQKATQEVPQITLAFDAVLGAFYNKHIDLGDFESDPISHILDISLKITKVAEYLGCVHIITNPIEATLLPTGQNLYHAISILPCAWLQFAYRIRSKAIFKEALIHAAGQWNTAGVKEAVADGALSNKVLTVLKAKARFIKNGVIMAQRHIGSYYPGMLMRERTVGLAGADNIGRSNYANDILMWIPLAVFRHWFCDMMASDQTHHNHDMGFAFMQAIDKGGNAYLSRSMLQNEFHARFPMSPKGMACVEHRLTEIKQNITQWSTPLMRNNSSLNHHKYPAKYFTHINVDYQDYPWDDEETESDEEGHSSVTADNDDRSPAHATYDDIQNGETAFRADDDTEMEDDFGGNAPMHPGLEDSSDEDQNGEARYRADDSDVEDDYVGGPLNAPMHPGLDMGGKPIGGGPIRDEPRGEAAYRADGSAMEDDFTGGNAPMHPSLDAEYDDGYEEVVENDYGHASGTMDDANPARFVGDDDDLTDIKSEAATSAYGFADWVQSERLMNAVDTNADDAMGDAQDSAIEQSAYLGKGKIVDANNAIGYNTEDITAANTLAGLKRSRSPFFDLNDGGDTEVDEDES